MTRMLAIETSARQGSVSLLGQGQPPESSLSLDLPSGVRTAQALAPAIEQLLRQAEWPPRSIGVVGVTTGPGSFTGLRIGVTTAKSFAYAVGADVIGVSTMEVLAEPVPPQNKLWTLLDAQREELFVASFAPDQHAKWAQQTATHVLSHDAWLAQLAAGDVVTGPILSRLADRLPDGVLVADRPLWNPRAQYLAQVAWRAYSQGRRDDVFQLVPDYFRLSAAEEKLH